jgi:hypothetical protein
MKPEEIADVFTDMTLMGIVRTPEVAPAHSGTDGAPVSR